jgi:hypothetical protein
MLCFCLERVGKCEFEWIVSARVVLKGEWMGTTSCLQEDRATLERFTRQNLQASSVLMGEGMVNPSTMQNHGYFVSGVLQISLGMFRISQWTRTRWFRR